MDSAADLLTMLTDFSNSVTIGGTAYKGLLETEEHTLADGFERVPVLLMRYADVQTASVVKGTDVVVDSVTYQVREIERLDDGRVAKLILVP
jgi:hypothetical protein